MFLIASCDQLPSTTSRSTSSTSAWGFDPRVINLQAQEHARLLDQRQGPLGLLAKAIGSNDGVSVAQYCDKSSCGKIHLHQHNA